MPEPKLRSRAYPAVSLKESIDLLVRLQNDLGWGERNRDSIAQSLGYANGKSGIGARKIAALVHFGFLGLRNGTYFSTGLAKQILEERNEARYRSSLCEACLNPSLFQEIIYRYEPVGRVPRQLGAALSLDHGIQENVRDEVAQIFMASARFAGILDVEGVFCEAYFETTKRPRPLSRYMPAPPAPSDLQGREAGEPQDAEKPQKIRFYLTDRKPAELRLPWQLNEEDLVLLRRQIDYLELQLRLNRPDQPVRLDIVRTNRKQ